MYNPKLIIFFQLTESWNVVETVLKEINLTMQQGESSNLGCEYMSIKEIITRRREERAKISNRYDVQDNQLTIIENYQIPKELFQKFIKLKSSDPLFDETLHKIVQNDIGGKLFKESLLDRTAIFKEQYMVGKQIGCGSYASVRICAEKQTMKQFALKIYNKQNMSSSRKKSILREIRILQMVRHSNIIKIYDTIETNNHVNLLLELVDGKALNTHTQFKQFSIKSVMHQVAQAINYLHIKQIAHRDIKMENIIYGSDGKIKIIDFGFSTLFSNQLKKKIYCGTPSYMAPEIVRKSYYRGPPVDIWALGVVLYILKTGQFPFKGQNDKELFYLIAQGQFNIEIIDDHYLQDLITRMLESDPNERITAQQVLQHPWFQESIPPQLSNRGTKSNTSSPRQINPYQQYQSTVKKREKVSVEFENIYQMNQCTDQESSYTKKGILVSYMSSVASNKSPIIKRKQSQNQTFDRSHNSSMINQKV